MERTTQPKPSEWLANLERPFVTDAQTAVAGAVACLIALITVMSFWTRMRLGVDLTDESFPIALAYRFVLGDRPFLHEFSHVQTSALILWPLVWLYVKLVGSTKGIILFSRCLFVASGTLAGGVVFATLRRHLFWPAALVVSLLCLAYVPFAIASPGYNALGMHLFTLGAFLCLRVAMHVRFRRAAYLAGLCCGLAVVAYPSYAPAVVLLVVCTVLVRSTARLACVGLMVSGGLTIALLVAPTLLRAGLSNVLACFTYSASLHSLPATKLPSVMEEWWKNSPISAALVPALVVCFAGLR